MFKRILLIGLISILVGIQNVPTVNSQGLTVVSNLIKGDVPTDPRSPAWDKAESNIIPLSSQIIANPRTFKLPKGKSSVREINVKSLNNGKDIAVLLEWDDMTENSVLDDTAVYRDAVAL